MHLFLGNYPIAKYKMVSKLQLPELERIHIVESKKQISKAIKTSGEGLCILNVDSDEEFRSDKEFYGSHVQIWRKEVIHVG